MDSIEGYTVWRIWAEWDLGIESRVFSTYEKAMAGAKEAFEWNDMEETVEEAMRAGLLIFTEYAVE